MRMRLRKPLLAQVLLLVSFLGALGFLGYLPILHTVEAGIACVVVLYAWLAFSINVDSRWVIYVFLPAFGLMFFILFYAFIYSIRVDTPLLPSVFAQRYYVFFLFAPVTYMLLRCGWNLMDFQRVFVLAVLFALMSRVIADLTLSPTLLSSARQFLVFKQDTAYEQSYWLRRADASAVFSILYFGRALLKANNLVSFGFSLVVTLLATTLLIVNAPRSLVASTVIVIALYGVFLSRRGRAGLLVVLLPLCILIIALLVPQLRNTVAKVLGDDLSYEVRVESARIAWEYFLRYPLFGFGQESNASVSYQHLFGEHFYPSDVGLLGVAFQWGLLGLLLYVSFSVWLVVNLLKLLWVYTDNAGKLYAGEGLFLWALFMLCLIFTISSPLQARFIKPEGLAIAAFALGLLWWHRRGVGGGHRNNVQRLPEPATNIQVERHLY